MKKTISQFEKNVEENVEENKLPDAKITGYRSTFDAVKVNDVNDINNGKYRVAMTVHNNPIQFGKAGRR